MTQRSFINKLTLTLGLDNLDLMLAKKMALKFVASDDVGEGNGVTSSAPSMSITFPEVLVGDAWFCWEFENSQDVC